jgi:hypothetical protein
MYIEDVAEDSLTLFHSKYKTLLPIFEPIINIIYVSSLTSCCYLKIPFEKYFKIKLHIDQVKSWNYFYLF